MTRGKAFNSRLDNLHGLARLRTDRGMASAAFSRRRTSAGDNANMLSATYTWFDIGRAVGTTGVGYWTTTIGRPRS